MTGELADGTPINANYTQATTADPAYPADLNTLADVFSTSGLLLVSATSTDEKRLPNILPTTDRVQLSGDGKTLTIVTKGKTAAGKRFQQTFVYEKQ
jgi:hypothetical protein